MVRMKLFSIVWFTSIISVNVHASQNNDVSFNKFKVYRIDANSQSTNLKSSLESLSVIELAHGIGDNGSPTLDVAVPPEHLAAFEASNFSSIILSEDLGVDIMVEGSLGKYPGVQTASYFQVIPY